MADAQIDWSRCEGFDHDFGDVHESLSYPEMVARIRTTGSTLPGAVEKAKADLAGLSSEAKTKDSHGT
jgi:hypothetical protein